MNYKKGDKVLLVNKTLHSKLVGHKFVGTLQQDMSSDDRANDKQFHVLVPAYTPGSSTWTGKEIICLVTELTKLQQVLYEV